MFMQFASLYGFTGMQRLDLFFLSECVLWIFKSHGLHHVKDEDKAEALKLWFEVLPHHYVVYVQA